MKIILHKLHHNAFLILTDYQYLTNTFLSFLFLTLTYYSRFQGILFQLGYQILVFLPEMQFMPIYACLIKSNMLCQK